MLHCNGIDPFVTFMGYFNWGPISRSDIVSLYIYILPIFGSQTRYREYIQKDILDSKARRCTCLYLIIRDLMRAFDRNLGWEHFEIRLILFIFSSMRS